MDALAARVAARFRERAGDDSRSRDLALKSLEAKKYAREVAGLTTLVLSFRANVASKVHGMAFGDERTAVLAALEELDEAGKGLAGADGHLGLAGARLERAGNPRYFAQHRTGTGSPAEPGEVWAPKVVSVGGVPIEDYVPGSGGKAKLGDVDHDFKSRMDTLVRTMTSDLRELVTAAEQVGRLDAGPPVARELLGLAKALQGQVRMVGEEVGKFASWVDAQVRTERVASYDRTGAKFHPAIVWAGKLGKYVERLPLLPPQEFWKSMDGLAKSDQRAVTKLANAADDFQKAMDKLVDVWNREESDLGTATLLQRDDK